MINDYQILSSEKIDRDKWDRCVDNNDNGLIYAKSIYLDHTAPGWKGIVFGDYDSIFPLCIKRKYGIKYAQKPVFSQQLGLIGSSDIDFEKLKKIILSQVKYGDIHFNFFNRNLIGHKTIERTNFIIDLGKTHEHIYKKYKYKLKSDLNKASTNHLTIVNGEAEETIDAYRRFLLQKTKSIDIKGFRLFTNLCFHEKFKNNFFVRKVVSSNNTLLASALFLIDRKRIYNIMAITFKQGAEVNAMHFLIDKVLYEFQQTDLIFDFEGSDLSGVKSFYEKFSPVRQPYYHYHFNYLPFPLNKLKK